MAKNKSIPPMLPHIEALETYEGVDPMEVMAERAGIPPEKIIRLNGNENPYGPSPKVSQPWATTGTSTTTPTPDSVTCAGCCRAT